MFFFYVFFYNDLFGKDKNSYVFEIFGLTEIDSNGLNFNESYIYVKFFISLVILKIFFYIKESWFLISDCMILKFYLKIYLII